MDFSTSFLYSVQTLLQDVAPENIKGLGFDATCSLAVCDSAGKPIAVDLNGLYGYNFVTLHNCILHPFNFRRSNLFFYFRRKTGDDDQNIILWMDHRAMKETDIINETKHPILKYVGGNVSPEMMVPKILWLKRNQPQCWKRAAHFFLLPDFMTWKATGDESR